jgi:AmmeMemoRadiSam system protein A
VNDELSPAARALLLGIARRAIENELCGRSRETPEVGPELLERRGAFVTLRQREGGDLRGCVGHVEPDYPLVESVARAAVLAATVDRRFEPVTRDELSALCLEISALGAVEPLRPEEVEVGVHGVILRYEDRSGLLLPQVAVDHGWDRDTFLDYVCVKARVPRGSWRRPECQLWGFTATVFGEE